VSGCDDHKEWNREEDREHERSHERTVARNEASGAADLFAAVVFDQNHTDLMTAAGRNIVANVKGVRFVITLLAGMWPQVARAQSVEGRITITRGHNGGGADAVFARQPFWGRVLASDGPCTLRERPVTEGLSAGMIKIRVPQNRSHSRSRGRVAV
jgi:hypothetical protein